MKGPWLFAAPAIAAVVSSHAYAAPLSAQDVGSLRALDAAYVDAWKQEGSAAQSAALLPLFEPDAVIMPGAGADPARGQAALKEFWFPAGASATDVTRFEHQIDAVEGEGDFAYVSGRARLDFTYEGSAVKQEGNFLFIAKRGSDGNWRIRRMIWNNRTLP